MPVRIEDELLTPTEIGVNLPREQCILRNIRVSGVLVERE